MSVTITISDGTVFTFNEGDIERISPDISSDLDFDSMPGNTPDASMLYDFNGVKKVIQVQGELQNTGTNRLSSGTAQTINQQRQWLEKNLNGQQSGAVFDSDYTSTWNGSSWVASPILFSKITFVQETGIPEGLPFTMTLFVGDV